MKKLLFYCFTLPSFVVLVSNCSSSENSEGDIVFDARELIGKSPEGIIEALGEPDSAYQRSITGKPYFVQYYNQYGVEVRHFQGSIVNIIVNEPYPLEFAPETITKFGFDYTEPTEYDSLAMITWKNIEGIKIVNFYLRGVQKPDSVKHSYHIFFNMDTTTANK